LCEALETASGAQENPLSTQAASDGDLLSVLIDDALAGNDPHTVINGTREMLVAEGTGSRSARGHGRLPPSGKSSDTHALSRTRNISSGAS
jgi:hypothetical protein